MAESAKKTPAKKTAAKAEAPKQGPQQIVPALPEGWTVTLTFVGPNGEEAYVGEDDRIIFTSSDGTKRRTKADSLALALRAAGAGVKALAKVAEQERKAREAQAAALSVLGDVDEDEADGDQADLAVGLTEGAYSVVPDVD